MSPDDTLLSEVCDLCIRAMDSALTTDEFDRFQNLLQSDKRARAYYFDIISTYIGLDDFQSVAGVSPEPERFNLLLEILADEEETAPALDIPKPNVTIPKELIHNVQREPIFKKPSKSSLFVLMASAAALLFLIVFAYFAPNRSSYDVATLADSIQAKWSRQHGAVSTGSRLFAQHSDYALESGIVMIDFDNMTRMTIEGPALFRFLSRDQIALDYGKVYAVVPPEAYGFEVTTPTAKIIDLGTEFGVRQGMGGNTDLHVVKGKTMLATVGRGRLYNTLVTAGAAKRLFKDADQAIDIPLADRLFVRHIDSQANRVWRGEPVDLADIVGGGNGFGSGITNAGIDPVTGEFVDEYTSRRGVSSGYTHVSHNPFVDGVFVPNGEDGPVRVSSMMHFFDGFIATNGMFWREPFNGGRHSITDDLKSFPMLDGSEYGTATRPVLMMHANLGITFDLDRLRRAFPRHNFLEFTALLGVPDHVEAQKPTDAIVDFVVLLDGLPMFSRDQVPPGSKPIPVSIKIAPHHRFLTLAVTDGGNGNHLDWALFAEPYLRLISGD